MAAVEKRTTSDGKTSYRVKIRLKGFAPETASFDRLTDARDWGRNTEAAMKAGRYFGQSKRHTFNELADEYQPHAKDAVRLDYWRSVFGSDTLDAITPARIAKERDRLLAACRPHSDLYLAVMLSLTTGARQAEIMGLRWGQIDFGRQVITLHQTKNGERRALPLVGEPFALLQERAKVRSLKDDRIFPPTSRAKKAERLDLRAPWEAATKAAAITDFRWHDLRHTAASYLAMSGVSLVEIAKVLGHRTLQMVARYSHLSDEHIVATGEKLAARLGVGGQRHV